MKVVMSSFKMVPFILFIDMQNNKVTEEGERILKFWFDQIPCKGIFELVNKMKLLESFECAHSEFKTIISKDNNSNRINFVVNYCVDCGGMNENS